MVISLLIGGILGFLAGLGIGGGSLLILWLNLVVGMDPEMARSINLMFFLPSALVSCCIRMRRGDLQVKKVLPAIAAGAVSAGVCSYLLAGMDTQLLKKLFGVLLLVTGVRELLYKPRP